MMNLMRLNTEQELINLLYEEFQNKGYSIRCSGKFELHSKPYLSFSTKELAIDELVNRKLNFMKNLTAPRTFGISWKN